MENRIIHTCGNNCELCWRTRSRVRGGRRALNRCPGACQRKARRVTIFPTSSATGSREVPVLKSVPPTVPRHNPGFGTTHHRTGGVRIPDQKNTKKVETPPQQPKSNEESGE